MRAQARANGMSWPVWLATWQTHARSAAFAKQLRQAVRIAKDASMIGPMYAAISGGKDSLALLAVLMEARQPTQLVHASSDLNLPETKDVVVAAAEIAGMPLDFVEPERSAWEILATLDGDITTRQGYNTVAIECSAGCLLVQYSYAGNWQGWFDGRRAAESRGRRINFAVRGSTYQSKVDGLTTCCPLADWSARDVMAAVTRAGLPIHPYYQRCHEKLRLDPEKQRIDWLLPNEQVCALGGAYAIRRLYPELWQKLLQIRPEIRKMP
jgi:3'-phosphoadenosine 5'-phosphosulfate sulfotransferase (PAPS reductase)/FAD synthetase